MSHLKERTQRNCLNCNAQVHGKYCHICGQENVEPVETVWHLVTHFFNDITHFDGKFFSTLKLLIFKPGFLTAEYKMGRRNNYLNPVRMYIFTSFIFFLVFFSTISPGDSWIVETEGKVPLTEIRAMDSTAFSNFTKTIKGTSMTRTEFEMYVDSKRGAGIVKFGHEYKSRTEYDSLIKAKKVNDGWLVRKLRHKQFEINEKYKKDSSKTILNLTNILLHNFPQMLFISLPLFAWFLYMMYYRRKDFYFVSHGIYTVHLYIFYFIVFMVMILLNKTGELTHWAWLGSINKLLVLVLFLYEYKAMRNFYGQGRGKTFLKFLLAGFWRIFIILILFIVFLFLSLLKV